MQLGEIGKNVLLATDKNPKLPHYLVYLFVSRRMIAGRIPGITQPSVQFGHNIFCDGLQFLFHLRTLKVKRFN